MTRQAVIERLRKGFDDGIGQAPKAHQVGPNLGVRGPDDVVLCTAIREALGRDQLA